MWIAKTPADTFHLVDDAALRARRFQRRPAERVTIPVCCGAEVLANAHVGSQTRPEHNACTACHGHALGRSAATAEAPPSEDAPTAEPRTEAPPPETEPPTELGPDTASLEPAGATEPPAAIEEEPPTV